jgi:GDP-4-dehydro-6-deoxy-D-mannose reductase
METIMITGLAGFVGSHLVDLLLQDPDVQIVGVIHPTHAVQHLEDHPRVKVIREDILKETRLRQILRRVQPEVIYHLAGLAHVHESWVHRKETIHTNFMGSFYLLEACRRLTTFPKVLLIGSAECYGVVPFELQPIFEEYPLWPASPYAVSKIAQEMLGMQYARAEKLPVYLSRSFNHTGPRQKETFVCSAFAYQIAIAMSQPKPHRIMVGNLVARRDFTDVRDVVRAYQAIVEKGRPGEPYNVCSGKAPSIEEVLNTLIELSGEPFEVQTDSSLFRPVDMPLVLGSNEKIARETGWKPIHDLRTSLKDLLDYWRMKVQGGVSVT